MIRKAINLKYNGIPDESPVDKLITKESKNQTDKKPKKDNF
jgi:hypothetical protein